MIGELDEGRCEMPVVAGIDDSKVTRFVIEEAISQARWRQMDLKVVHVLHMPPVYGEVAIDWYEVGEAQRSAVWAGVEDVLGHSDVEVERVDLEGYPPDTLVDYARDVDASLLVVGTRGRGDLASLILGSTSHRAIQLADCDVLVVKNPELG
jgi:nucleotide-binding universal stress UspA family protein